MRGATIMDWFGDTFFIISIHAPHAGRDPRLSLHHMYPPRFQSTRPMRGATSCLLVLVSISLYFNPRAPCGARRKEVGEAVETLQFQSTRPMRGATFIRTVPNLVYDISIHAPHAGRDCTPPM